MRPPQGNVNDESRCHPDLAVHANSSQSFGRLPNQSDRSRTEPINTSEPMSRSKLLGKDEQECGPTGHKDELTGTAATLVPVALHSGGEGGGLDGSGGSGGVGGLAGVIDRGPQSPQSDP